MRKKLLQVTIVLLSAACIQAQTNAQGKILKWDTEAYGKHGNVTRNAAIYYVRVGETVYRVTRGTTKPESGLEPGQQVTCRVEKDHMFISIENEKERKFAIVGAAAAE